MNDITDIAGIEGTVYRRGEKQDLPEGAAGDPWDEVLRLRGRVRELEAELAKREADAQ